MEKGPLSSRGFSLRTQTGDSAGGGLPAGGEEGVDVLNGAGGGKAVERRTSKFDAPFCLSILSFDFFLSNDNVNRGSSYSHTVSSSLRLPPGDVD